MSLTLSAIGAAAIALAGCAPRHQPARIYASSSGTSRTASGPAAAEPLVVLNPGHNGGNATHLTVINRLVPAGFVGRKTCDTTGTATKAGYPEHAFNWDVSVRVRTILQSHAVRVALTRPNDTGVGPCLDRRAAIGNQPGSVAVVSIHADPAKNNDHGFYVSYGIREPAGPEVDSKSRQLSLLIHNSLEQSSGLTPASYVGDGLGFFPRDDLAGLSLSTAPATFLELGNMHNRGDAALQSSAADRQRIAEAVAAGILAYLRR